MKSIKDAMVERNIKQPYLKYAKNFYTQIGEDLKSKFPITDLHWEERGIIYNEPGKGGVLYKS